MPRAEKWWVPSSLLLLLLGICFSTSRVQSAVIITLPTQGYYRPGRYMPVKMEGQTPSDSITLLGRETVPTEIARPDSMNVIVPWLIVSDMANDARWESAGGQNRPLSLHALSDEQRLVGFAGAPAEAASLLFAGNPIVPVRLDESRPLLEPVEAWECLDAVVLSAPAAARVDEAHRTALLAAGTIIAVRADRPPDDHWPWQLRGGFWVLQYKPAGPRAIIEPDAYGPVQGSDLGRPIAFRRSLMLAAVLFCILSMATLLWRSRWAVLGFILVCVLFMVGIVEWYSRQSPVLQLASAIRIDAGPISQLDLWTWQSSVRPTDASVRYAGLTHPILATIRQIDRSRLRLVCRPDGRPERFTFHLNRGESLAMQSRQLGVASPLPKLAPASEPWASFADAFYVPAGRRILGQYQPAGATVPVIVIGDREK